MIEDITDVDICLLPHFAVYRVFEALARLDKSGDGRISLFRPTGLTPQEAVFTMRNEHDNRGINAREERVGTVIACTTSGIATRLGNCQRTTCTTVLLQSMPVDQCNGMRQEICLVDRQYRAEISKIMKFAIVFQRGNRAVDFECECRFVVENT